MIAPAPFLQCEGRTSRGHCEEPVLDGYRIGDEVFHSQNCAERTMLIRAERQHERGF